MVSVLISPDVVKVTDFVLRELINPAALLPDWRMVPAPVGQIKKSIHSHDAIKDHLSVRQFQISEFA